jgi:hypothetical protein
MADSPVDVEKIRRRVEKRLRRRRGFYIHLEAYAGFNFLIFLIWGLIGAIVPGITQAVLGIFSGALGQLIADILRWVFGPTIPLLIAVAWGIGLGIHGLVVYNKSGAGEQARERAIQREVERERQRLYGDRYGADDYEKRKNEGDEKPKRGVVRLADDGELIYEDEEGQELRRSSQRRG